MNPAGVSIQSVTKQFGEKFALRDVSMEFAAGTFNVLLGPSGSGKTTLLRCLAGIERPTSGTIAIGDQVVCSDAGVLSPEKRHLSMVFQDYALWPHLTVRQNVGYPLATSKWTKPERRARVADLLERVGIEHLTERFPNELSGGEQQRVALARALAADVGLILFDEPLSNLDADRREQLRIEIATLTRAAGATAVYITHDQSEAFALADRIGVLRQGTVVQFGTPEEIYQRPASSFVAHFTGVAGEFSATTFRRNTDQTATVALAFAPGRSVEASVPQQLADNQPASLFVRAAGVALSDEPREGLLPASVLDVAFTGRGYEHVVALAPRHTLTKVFAERRFDRGSTAYVALDPKACFLMATEVDRN